MGSPTLVVLGASGDLAARLLFPALLSLERRERLEDLHVVGYARQEWSTDQFHENLRAAMSDHIGDVEKKYFEKFIERIDFHGGDISVESLRQLHSVIDGPSIFYLALPPGVFADAAETIANAGLADESIGWRRLSCSASPTGSSSRSCAPRTSTRSRSPWRRRSGSRVGRATTTASARCATWSRTT
jgi:glucose-6-phosphate 1-dehydrogenase